MFWKKKTKADIFTRGVERLFLLLDYSLAVNKLLVEKNILTIEEIKEKVCEQRGISLKELDDLLIMSDGNQGETSGKARPGKDKKAPPGSRQ